MVQNMISHPKYSVNLPIRPDYLFIRVGDSGKDCDA